MITGETAPIIVFACAGIALAAILIIAYQRSRVNYLARLFEPLLDHPLTPPELPATITGLPSGAVGILNEVLSAIRAEAEVMTRQAGQLRASNRVLSYSKHKFDAILDSSPDGMLVIDFSGNVVVANQAVELLLGADRAKLTGRHLKEWWDHPDWAGIVSWIGSDRTFDLKKEAAHYKRTLRVFLKSIGRADLQWGQVVVIRDITEQQLAESARVEFVAHVSHELKAPLNTLKSYTEMLMDGEANDETTRREFCNVINSEADRLSALIGNLLSITKIEMGSLQIQWNRVKTQEFLQNLYQIAENQKRGKHINMHLVLPDRLPAIRADKDLLSVAILNLLSNAIKYTDEGKSVTLKAEDQEDVLMIHVIDSGLGIAAADLPHVFEKFYRSEDQRVRERPGHGLGLSLAQQIVSLHDGEIRVISHPGEGSQFTVILKKEADVLQ